MDASSEDKDTHLPSTSDASIVSSQKEARSVTGLSIGGNCNIHGSAFVKVMNTTTFGIENPKPEEKLIFQVKDPIITFTGRKEFLKKLHKDIQECSKKDVNISILSQTSSITGLGGIGKSETVRMYIKKYGQEYDNIVWIDAEHPSETTEQLKSLADHKLNIRLKDHDDKPRKFPHILEEVYEKLCRKPKRLLIIFDNAEALDDSAPLNDGIGQFLPPQTTTIEPPVVLVTSRQKNWKDVNLITLGLWDPEECIEYIFKRLKLENTQENTEDAKELAALFDKLPIAIEIAVSVILQQSAQKQRVSKSQDYYIQNLISDYKSYKKDLRDSDQPLSVQATIKRLLHVSIDKIKNHKQGQLGINILVFMAYLSPTKIPKVIIRNLFDEMDANDNTLDNALELLVRYSLIGFEINEESFTIHRVIQDAIIMTLPNLKIPRIKFIPTFLMCSDELTVLRHITNKFAANLSLQHSDSTQENNNNTIIANIIHTTDRIIQHSMTLQFYSYIEDIAEFVTTKQFKVAIKLYIALIDCDINIKKLPPVQIFPKLAVVADIFYRNHRYANSLEIFNTVLYGGTIRNKELFDAIIVIDEGEEKVFGSLHPKTLITKTNLASCLSRQGRYTEAMKLFNIVLNEKENVVGALHLEALAAKHNIASCLSCQGLSKEGLQLYKEVLEGTEKILCSTEPEVLLTKHSMACCLSDLGQTEEAMKLFYVVLEGRQLKLGALHEDTLNTQCYIANCLNDLSQFEEALKLYNFVLREKENVLGSLHPETLNTKKQIVLSRSNQGKDEETLRILHAVLEAQEKELGLDHQDTWSTKQGIGKYLSDKGQQKEALELFNVLLKTQEKAFGCLHPDTLNTKYDIANCLSRQGKSGEALKLYYFVLEGREKILGALHPDTLNTKHNIGVCLSNEGKHEEALKVYNAVLEAREKTLGALHLDTLNTNNNKGVCLSYIGKQEEALKIYDVVLHAREKTLGACHPATLETKHYIGESLMDQGKYEDALKLYYVVLETREKALGAHHQGTLNTKQNIAGCLFNQGKYEEAVKLYYVVLEAAEKIFGSHHPNTLSTKNDIASCFLLQGRHEDALKLYHAVLEAREKVLGASHPDTLKTKQDIQTCLSNVSQP